MAARNLAPLRTLKRGVAIIAGSFAPNGSSAVSASSRTGPGWSVARTNAGIFTVTLSDKFTYLLSATATLQLATAADQYALIGTVDLSAKTIIINVWDVSSAALADISANANNRINFCFVLSDSAADPIRG